MAETPPPNGDPSRFSYDQVDWFVENRAPIERAKGILMFVYGIDADHAFQLIRSQARTTRVSLRMLAEQFVDDVTTLTPEERINMHSACRNVLLTAHHRVRDALGGPGPGAK